jgi:hypothetical protein
VPATRTVYGGLGDLVASCPLVCVHFGSYIPPLLLSTDHKHAQFLCSNASLFAGLLPAVYKIRNRFREFPVFPISQKSSLKLDGNIDHRTITNESLPDHLATPEFWIINHSAIPSIPGKKTNLRENRKCRKTALELILFHSFNLKLTYADEF